MTVQTALSQKYITDERRAEYEQEPAVNCISIVVTTQQNFNCDSLNKGPRMFAKYTNIFPHWHVIWIPCAAFFRAFH